MTFSKIRFLAAIKRLIRFRDLLNPKMHILFLWKNKLNLGYGGENSIKQLSASLSVKNKITVATGGGGANNTDFKNLLEKSGIQILESSRKIVSNLKSDTEFMNQLKAVLNDVDIIYALDFPTSPLITRSLMRSQLALPIIKGHHTPLNVRNHSLAPRRIQAYYKFIKPIRIKAYGRFHYHHVINSADEKVLQHWRGTKIFRIPSGINIAEHSPLEKFDEFTLLFLGRLDFQKGFDFLPELFNGIRDNVGKFKLIIGGEGRMKKLAFELSESDSRIEYRGFLTQEDRFRLLAKSHLILFPSRWETYGLVPLEGMASGTPSVSFDIPGPTEYIRNGRNGYLVNTLQQMVRCIGDVAGSINDEEYRNLSGNALTDAKEYDWSLIAQKYQNMFNSVLDETEDDFHR